MVTAGLIPELSFSDTGDGISTVAKCLPLSLLRIIFGGHVIVGGCTSVTSRN